MQQPVILAIITLLALAGGMTPRCLVAQPTRIAGVINSAAGVDAIWVDCDQHLLLDRGIGLVPGDRVLIVQMKGAEVDTQTNVGAIVAARQSGRFEFGTVRAMQGTQVTLRAHLHIPFDVDNGRVQLVRVARFDDAVVVDTVRALPWDGRRGGVIALDVADSLRLQAPIDASGAGFRGGRASLNRTGACAVQTLLEPYASGRSAEKGEGCADVPVAWSAGRSPWASGGGGGAAHNSGGGGGGNGGIGGKGGNEWEGCTVISPNGGLGAERNLYDVDSLTLHFGGGGGGGHQNNGFGSDGGNGGGVVYVRATRMFGGGHALIAAGRSADTTQNDGGGGGGAGGTIMLDADSLALPLTLDVRGGDGAWIGVNSLHGPGGGGGGGTIILAGRRLPPGIGMRLEGGQRGTVVNRTAPQKWNGSADGDAGRIVLMAVVPAERDSVPDVNIRMPNDTVACVGDSLRLSATATGGSGSLRVQWETDAGDTLQQGDRIALRVDRDTVLVCRATDAFGCMDMDTIRVRAFRGVELAIGTIDLGAIATCGRDVDTSITITVIGSEPANIQSITSSDPRVLLSVPQLPVVLANGQLTIPVRIRGSQAGRVTSRIELGLSGCRPRFSDSVSATFVEPSVSTPDTIDMGWVPHCTAVGITRTLTITNTTPDGFSATIDSVLFTGPFAVTLAAGDVIDTSRVVDVQWTPSSEGVVTGTITMRVAPCGTLHTVHLRAEVRRSTLVADTLITLDRSTDRAQAVVRNTGAVDVRVDSVRTTDADMLVFGTLPSLPTTLASGDSIVVDVGARANTLVATARLLAYSAEPCDTITSTTIRRSIWARATVTAPRLISAPGEIVVVPITITDVASNIKGALRDYRAELRVRRAALDYVGHDTTRPVVLRERTVGDTLVLAWSGTWDTSDTLCALRFLGLFEGSAGSPLDLSDAAPFAFVIAASDVLQVDGEVDLRGRICARNGRLVTLGSVLMRVEAYDVTGRALGSDVIMASAESDVVRCAVQWRSDGPIVVIVRDVSGVVLGTLLIAP